MPSRKEEVPDSPLPIFAVRELPMSFRTIVLLPLRRLWQGIKPILLALDDALVAFAVPFGVQLRDPRRRLSVLLGVYLAIYVLAFLPIPLLPLAALVFGYIGVLAVGRAWVNNEKLRTRIVKKLENLDPDTLPDLRWDALLSALQLLVLFPLLFWRLDSTFHWFSNTQDATSWDWVVFTFDSLAKALGDLPSLFGLHLEHKIDYRSSMAASVLSAVKRLTIDWILIQGIIRLFAINTTISEGVAALKQDPDVTRRVGRRAVESLIEELHNPDKTVRAAAVQVLGDLRDDRAVDGLAGALDDPEVDIRWRATLALGQIGSSRAVEPLVKTLRSPDLSVRSGAVQALAEIGDGSAVPLLLPLLSQFETPTTRATAIESLQRLHDVSAVEPLIEALRDPQEEVGKAAATALGQLGDLRAVEPLIEALRNPAGASGVRWEAARALEELGDAKAVPVLVQTLLDPDMFLRKCCAHALGKLHDPQTIPALLPLLREAAPELREAAALALAKMKDPRVVEALAPLVRDPSENVRIAVLAALEAQQDPSTAAKVLDALKDGDKAIRKQAAELLGKLGDRGAVPSLIDALQDREAEVRETAAWALGKLGDGRAIEALTRATNDSVAGVREQASAALRQLKMTDGVPAH
jgi:HEAT repeat protein